MTVAIRGLAVLLAALAVPAAASVPTDDQVRRLQQTLGFDNAMDRVLDEKMDEQPALTELSATERACIVGELKPVMKRKLDGAFKQLFGDEQTAGAWLAFAETDGGRTLMAFVREGVVAKLEERPAPSPEAALGGMPLEAMGEVAAFMSTPEAKVLEREFPDVDMDDAEMDAFMAAVADTCGIDKARL